MNFFQITIVRVEKIRKLLKEPIEIISRKTNVKTNN